MWVLRGTSWREERMHHGNSEMASGAVATKDDACLAMGVCGNAAVGMHQLSQLEVSGGAFANAVLQRQAACRYTPRSQARQYFGGKGDFGTGVGDEATTMNKEDQQWWHQRHLLCVPQIYPNGCRRTFEAQTRRRANAPDASPMKKMARPPRQGSKAISHYPRSTQKGPHQQTAAPS